MTRVKVVTDKHTKRMYLRKSLQGVGGGEAVNDEIDETLSSNRDEK
jgi:hypothetical protein